MNTTIVKALADIYIAVEETTKPMDVFNSRPRKLPENIDKVNNELVDLLAEHFGESEDTLILQIRPLIRKAIPLGGANIGYADEGLNLAEMCGRAIRR